MFASGAKPNPCKLNHLSPPLSRARLEEEGREGGRRISLEESIALCAFKRRRKWKRRREGGERERQRFSFPFTFLSADLSTLFPRAASWFVGLLIIFTFDARRLVWMTGEPADTFHPLPSPLFFPSLSPLPAIFFLPATLFTHPPPHSATRRGVSSPSRDHSPSGAARHRCFNPAEGCPLNWLVCLSTCPSS